MIGEKLQMDYIIYGCVVNDLKSKESKLKLKKIEEGSNINLIAYDTMLVNYGKMIEMLKNFRSMVKQDTEKLTTIKPGFSERVTRTFITQLLKNVDFS